MKLHIRTRKYRLMLITLSLAAPALLLAQAQPAAAEGAGPKAIAVSPAKMRVFAGGMFAFTAVLDNGVPVTNLATWSLKGPGTVSRQGLFTAGAIPGANTISAQYQGRTATAVVEVLPPPSNGSALILSAANTGSAAHDIVGVSIAVPNAAGLDPRSLVRSLKIMFTPESQGVTRETGVCELYWDAGLQHASLVTDAGAMNSWQFAADAAPNENSGTAANSQCTLFERALAVYSAGGGTVIDLSFELAFSPAFAGAKNIQAAYELETADHRVIQVPWTRVGQWTVPGYLQPDVRITTPLAGSVVSGPVTIRGIAVDNLTRPESLINAGSLRVYVDGVQVSSAVTVDYHLADETQTCSAAIGALAPVFGFTPRDGPAYVAPGCPDTGFSFTWDSATVANGAHTITISADDSDPGGAHTGTWSTTVQVSNSVVSSGTAAAGGSEAGVPARRAISTGAHLLSVNGAGAYTYLRPLTIDHTKVPNTDQSNFPLLVSISDPLLASAANGGHVASAGGYDMIFTADSGCATKLNHEVEAWNAITGQFTAWVSVPALSHTTDTAIYLCYGNASIATDQSNQTAVWDSNYKAVYHLSQDPAGAAPQLLDSTGNGVNLALTNHYGPAASSATGEIGGSVYFPWQGEFHGTYASSGSVASGAGPGARTVSTWMNFHTLPVPSTGVVGTIPLPTQQSVFTLGTGPNNTFELFVLQQWIGINVDAPTSVTPGQWYYVAGSFDGTTYQLYVNGVPVASAAAGGNVPADAPIYLGQGYYQYFSDVQLDETRFSSSARSADWIATEYNNQSNPSTFYTVGAETASSSVTNVTAANAAATYNSAAQTVTLSATVTSQAGPVNTGTVAFSMQQASLAPGMAATANAVSNGVATTSLVLPGATPARTYSFCATYNGVALGSSGDCTHVLTVNRAPSSTSATNVTSAFSGNGQNVNLSATVISPAGAVNEGAVTFAIMQNSVTVGMPVTSTTVTGGTASTTYTLPGNTLPGPYTIVATYNSGGNFAVSSDRTHTLTVQAGSYSYSRSLTISHTKVPNTNRTNFPVLVNITDSLLKSTSNGGHVANPNGYDMIFTSDAGCASKLNHEVDGWSALTGQFTAWVNVPTLSHTADTVIYLCYGNAAVTTDQSNKTAVWDGNFKAVYHLSQGPAGAAPQLLDSTSNRVNLTMSNSYAPAAVSEAGAIGSSVYLPWAGEYHGNSASSKTVKSGVGAGARTVSTWMNFHTLPAPSTGVVGTIPLPTQQNVFTLGTGPNNTLELFVLQQWFGINIDAPVSITPGSWYYVAGEFDGKTYRLYVNGVQVASAAANGNVPADAPVYLGLGYYQYFSDVQLDETRFSNTARSADWIATEYNNQSNPSTFYSVGAETAASPSTGGGLIPFNGSISGVTSTQALARFTVTDPSACSIMVYTDAARTIPAHDSDACLFPGANACNRAGNVVSGHTVNAVLGSRTVQMGADLKAYSRALAQQTHYWGLITDLTSSQTQNFEFTTAPIPFGQTWNDPLPALEPWISPTDPSQTIIDPHTGATLQRLTLANDITGQQGLVFSAPASAPGWTDPANIGSASSFASVSAFTSAIFIPDADATVAGNGGTHGSSNASGYGAGLNSLSVSLNAWCSTSACATASADDRALQVALSVDGGITAATNWRDIVTSYCYSNCGSANVVSVGGTTPYLADWISTPLPSFDVTQLAQRSGAFTAQGTVVTWAGNSYFPLFLSPGAVISLNGVPNTIAAVNTERQITLAAPATSTSGTWSIQPFGLMIRKKTAGSNAIQAQSLSATLTYSLPPTWDQAGTAQGNVSCSSVPVAGPTGTGVHCWVNPGLYWVNTTTGQRTFLGMAKLPYNPANPDGWNSAWCQSVLWDPADGNKATCYATRFGYLVSMEYSGGNNDVGSEDWTTPLTWCSGNGGGSSPPCWNFTNAAAPSQGSDLVSLFKAWSPATAAYAAQYGVAVNFGTVEGSELEFQIRPANGNVNNTLAWTAIYDPAQANFVAVSLPTRWAGLHGASPSGYAGWAIIQSEGFQGPLTGTDVDGNGPYISLLAAALPSSAAITCPAYDPTTNIPQAEWPVGNVCANVSVNGQPYDPTPGPSEPAGSAHIGNQSGYYMYSMQPGDKFCMAPAGSTYWNANIGRCPEMYQGGEFMRVLQVNGDTSVTVQRGYFGPTSGSPGTAFPFQNWNSGDSVMMIPSACLTGWQGWGCANVGAMWNYAVWPNDPVVGMSWTGGTGSGHGIAGDGWAIQAVTSLVSAFDNDSYWAYNITAGASPTTNSASVWAPLNAPFNGYLGEGSPNAVDSHPSAVQPTFFLDARPFLGDTGLTSCTPVSGTLLKCASSRLRRKYLPTLAIAGSAELQDVSGPSSAISGLPADSYKYCVAVTAGECSVGSAPGDLFVNPGPSSQTGCSPMGIGSIDADLTSVCVGDNGSYTAGVTQNQLQSSLFEQMPPTGAASRVITQGLSRYFWTDQFWNAKSTPDGSWALIHTRWAGLRDEAFLVRMPPIAGSATVVSGYVSVPVAVAATAWARVRFGYSTSFQCSTDGDACVTGGQPWSYLREKPAPSACGSGCTINVPAIPGRVLYYRVESTDASGNLLSFGPTIVQIQ